MGRRGVYGVQVGVGDVVEARYLGYRGFEWRQGVGIRAAIEASVEGELRDMGGSALSFTDMVVKTISERWTVDAGKQQEDGRGVSPYSLHMSHQDPHPNPPRTHP